MRKLFIRHENLKKILEKIYTGDEDIQEEMCELLLNELKHSCLIMAVDVEGDDLKFQTLEFEGKTYGFLFTDMDEFRKVFSDEESGSHHFDFEIYQQIVELGVLDGFLINQKSESFLLKKDLFSEITEMPEHIYGPDNTYSATELLNLKKSMDNSELESFLEDSSNIGNYEELFALISKSTPLAMMLSRDDLSDFAEDDIICMEKTGPVAFLYIDEVGGNYAALFTSEDKMRHVDTGLNMYSQIVNFSMMCNFILNDDMDGIIINPESDNVVLTREVLFEFSSMLEKTCNDSRLNSAIMHLFLMESPADESGEI